MGCPYCRNEDSKQLTYLQNEEFPGIEVLVCQSVDGISRNLMNANCKYGIIWEDLRTLPEFRHRTLAKRNIKTVIMFIR